MLATMSLISYGIQHCLRILSANFKRHDQASDKASAMQEKLEIHFLIYLVSSSKNVRVRIIDSIH
jgi:hypothetical protein